MRVRFRAGPGWHPHERDDHAIALDTSTVRGRIKWPAQNVVGFGEVEQEFTGAGTLGAGRSRGNGLIGHVHTFHGWQQSVASATPTCRVILQLGRSFKQPRPSPT